MKEKIIVEDVERHVPIKKIIINQQGKEVVNRLLTKDEVLITLASERAEIKVSNLQHAYKMKYDPNTMHYIFKLINNINYKQLIK